MLTRCGCRPRRSLASVRSRTGPRVRRSRWTPRGVVLVASCRLSSAEFTHADHRRLRAASGDATCPVVLCGDAVLVAKHPVRVEDVLSARSLVEGLVALGRLVE